MRFFISILLVLSFLLSEKTIGQNAAVNRTDSISSIEGEEYYIHQVESKQTLFSIASTYEVKLSRIAFDNPGVLDGLQLGQMLKILKSAEGETRTVEVSDEKLELDGEYILYKVPRRQTLYAISKEYNTTVAAILDANPELVDGLKVGSTIRVPVPKILEDQEFNRVEMVGLPKIIREVEGQQMLSLEEQITPHIGSHITLLLPLYLDLNDTITGGILTEENEKIYDKSEIALQFYEGFLLALDTLHQIGYHVEVDVIDTENRPWKLRDMIKKGKVKNTDLIVGPLYSKVFKEVADYAFENCIPIVSPTIKNDNIVIDNDYVFKQIPSEESMAFEMGRYLAQSDSTMNLILHYGAGDEQNLLWRFRQGLEASGLTPATFPSYDIYKTGTDSIRNKLSLSARNNLVILSNNQVKLAGLLRKITGWTEDAYIVGYAPSNWQNFKNLEIDHFDDLRIHMPMTFHVDYQDLAVQLFVQKFRLKFQGEPTTFAFRGYDLAMHFIRNLNAIKQYGPEHMLAVEETGLQSAFGWKKLPEGGFENTHARMVDYTGLQLKLATD